MDSDIISVSLVGVLPGSDGGHVTVAVVCDEGAAKNVRQNQEREDCRCERRQTCG